jgi:oligosaccharide repeat unit polymerase
MTSADIPSYPTTIRISRSTLIGVSLSAVATLLIGLPCLQGNPLYSDEQTLTILSVHFVVLCFPMTYATRVFQKTRDFFHPSLIAAATFLIFQVLVNPVIYGEPRVLASRNLDIGSDTLRTATILHSYFVLFIAWCAYVVGGRCPPQANRGRRLIDRTSTRLFFALAAAFVILGIIGNIGIIGGVGTYLSKMARPWERWSEYEEGSTEGGTKWTILMRFLPVGLVVLAYGIYLYYKLRPRAVFGLLFGAAAANLFLSCASGGRGTMLSTALYGIVLVNHTIRKLSAKVLASIVAVIVVFSFILGQLRGAAYFQTDVVYVDNSVLVQFGSLYLSNYLGTLTLVAQVEREGTIHGATAFSGMTGLLGGPNPLTTEMEVWYRVTGRRITENPRYGAPGELYFNFGLPGVIIGMFLVGVLVAKLAQAYERAAHDISLGGGMLAVYAAFTANFIMIANLSYMPPYFTFQSVPFYVLFWLYRRRRT